MKLRIEVPLWRNVAEAKHPSPDSQAEESDTDSPASGSRERSPRYAQPVPVGGVELPEVETEVATEEEDTVAEPTYAFARGFGRFVIRYTRLATALGNFEQGSIQTESTAVAYWLTSGLKVAMARVGWNLLSPRYGLTRLPGELLKRYYSQGYPQLQEEDRPYHQYGPIVYTEAPLGRTSCLVTPCSERTWNAINRSFEDNRERAETIWWLAINPGAQLLPPEVAAPHRLPAQSQSASPTASPALVVAVRDLW